MRLLRGDFRNKTHPEPTPLAELAFGLGGELRLGPPGPQHQIDASSNKIIDEPIKVRSIRRKEDGVVPGFKVTNGVQYLRIEERFAKQMEAEAPSTVVRSFVHEARE